ncbi:MAG: acyl-CoA thioesterase [Nocardioidaceae bacterium]
MSDSDAGAVPHVLAEFPASRRITTRWMDEDVYGHVNNVTYYSFFDTAVNGYLIEATGADIRTLDAVGVVAETSCRFERELRFPADVQVGIAVERLGTSSIVYRLGIFQDPEPTAAALGRFVHVYVDARTRAVTPVPPAIRQAVGRIV